MGSCREIHVKYQQEREEKISELVIIMIRKLKIMIINNKKKSKNNKE